ncbi:MAG: biotin attachment protein, partial [Sphaerochaetaceae bacterium]|nr:biotin attachment protein [Sphaerochaetaceae bacterium]
AKGGFGTSVTPVSQFYFQQAFNNVIYGPWKKIAEGYGKMVLGYFGKTPVEPDPEVVKIAAEQLKKEPTTKKVVDINDADPNKGREAAIKMLKENNIEVTEENIFIAASCKEKGILYLTGKSKVNGVRKADPAEEAAKKAGEYTVTVNGKAYGVKLGASSATVNGTSYPISVAMGINESAIASAQSAAPAAVISGSEDVTAPMPGLILRIECKEGQAVKKNQLIMVMEAMKMENEIYAPCDGIIGKILVTQGQQVVAGDKLASMGTSAAAPQAAPAPSAAPAPAPSAAPAGGEVVSAPMPGLVLRIEVKEGQTVKKNQVVMVMEAMKMENEIFAPCDGTITKVSVSQGQQLTAGDPLMTIA